MILPIEGKTDLNHPKILNRVIEIRQTKTRQMSINEQKKRKNRGFWIVGGAKHLASEWLIRHLGDWAAIVSTPLEYLLHALLPLLLRVLAVACGVTVRGAARV